MYSNYKFGTHFIDPKAPLNQRKVIERFDNTSLSNEEMQLINTKQREFSHFQDQFNTYKHEYNQITNKFQPYNAFYDKIQANFKEIDNLLESNSKISVNDYNELIDAQSMHIEKYNEYKDIDEVFSELTKQINQELAQFKASTSNSFKQKLQIFSLNLKTAKPTQTNTIVIHELDTILNNIEKISKTIKNFSDEYTKILQIIQEYLNLMDTYAQKIDELTTKYNNQEVPITIDTSKIITDEEIQSIKKLNIEQATNIINEIQDIFPNIIDVNLNFFQKKTHDKIDIFEQSINSILKKELTDDNKQLLKEYIKSYKVLVDNYKQNFNNHRKSITTYKRLYNNLISLLGTNINNYRTLIDKLYIPIKDEDEDEDENEEYTYFDEDYEKYKGLVERALKGISVAEEVQSIQNKEIEKINEKAAEIHKDILKIASSAHLDTQNVLIQQVEQAIHRYFSTPTPNTLLPDLYSAENNEFGLVLVDDKLNEQLRTLKTILNNNLQKAINKEKISIDPPKIEILPVPALPTPSTTSMQIGEFAERMLKIVAFLVVFAVSFVIVLKVFRVFFVRKVMAKHVMLGGDCSLEPTVLKAVMVGGMRQEMVDHLIEEE